MNPPEESLMLRIMIGEADRWHHQPLYEAIVLHARELGLAGATVLRGPMGFGASTRVHTAKILQLSADLPVVVEIIDAKEKIEAFLPTIGAMINGGMVTTHVVRVVHCAAASPDPSSDE